ncbi:MAG: C-GCAxxG-C-C family protein [Pseudoflavonifractor sp.]|nr:C-GCAxxG-C-C family protein [Pseudoflavonifractor sp.]
MKAEYTLDERVNRARTLKSAGYNCSQCVMMAFDDIHGLDDEKAAALSVALGGGVAGQGLTCGAMSAIAMLKGMTAYGKPADKSTAYSEARVLCGTFKTRNGSLLCSELKQSGRRPCIELIEDAIAILHNSLAGR